MFRGILWIVIALCLYMILTTREVEVFSVVGFIGFISTWLLIKVNRYMDGIDEIDKMG
tara:strand:+ start:5642 stop:5815 length:174 start_codon:yes stop_codon:yes gene_type:complete